MSRWDVVRRPAVIRLWLKRAMPVYLFVILSLLAIRYGFKPYLRHKYPTIVKKEKFLFFNVGRRVYRGKWVRVYNTWSPFLFSGTAAIACLWMLLLLKSTVERANDLSIAALEKAEKAQAADEMSQAIYYLKVASSFTADARLREDINRKIQEMKSSLASRTTGLGRTFPARAEPGLDKTAVQQAGGAAEFVAGRYRRVRKLGQGGMGVVWLAEDTTLERQIAIKELPLQLTQDRDLRDRFFREAKLLAKLTHPNIVQVYDILEDSGAVYYTMEFVDGLSLDRAAKTTRLPLTTIVGYALQMLKGIEYAHGMNIVHRDLKPMNIMVRNDGMIKIADFGLAKLVGSSSLTMVGTVMGSPMYMSPEQALGEDVDARSDLYSFSMILYELITGSPAFSGGTKEIIAQQIHAVPAPPSSILDVPRWIDDLIAKGTAKDKSQRYQNASEIMAAIEKHAGDV